MASVADAAWFECPACGNGIAYFNVATRHLGSLHRGQIYAVPLAYCQCEGFPGYVMELRAPDTGRGRADTKR